MVELGLIIIVVGVVVAAYYGARRSGLLATGQPAGDVPEKRRISLLTEAVAYLGAILLLAGAITAIGQRWNDLTRGAQTGVLATAAAFFLLIGLAVRRAREPAIQRLVGVAWVLSAVGLGWTVAVATLDAHGDTGRFTVLLAGAAVTAYSTVLWLGRRRALQNIAVFAGLVVTAGGTVVAIAQPGPPLAFGLTLWVLGLVWAGLGWRRYVQPVRVTLLSGALLALAAPSFGIPEHGWVFTIAIATAAAAMAASIPLRTTPVLAMGALAMFGYVTAAVIRYFSDSLGIPTALAITGLVIIVLAVVSTRLLRAAHPGRTPRR